MSNIIDKSLESNLKIIADFQGNEKLHLFDKLKLPNISQIEMYQELNKGDKDPLFHLLGTKKNLFGFSLNSCYQQLFVIRSWIPNLNKLPKIQKKRLWEQCLTIDIFEQQNKIEQSEKLFNRNPDFGKLINKWAFEPMLYLISITVFFGAVGYLIESNVIKNHYYYPYSTVLVYENYGADEQVKNKKKQKNNNETNNSTSINNNASDSETETETETESECDSETSEDSLQDSNLSNIQRSTSLPSLPTVQSLNKNYIKKSQRSIPIVSSTTTTTTTTTYSKKTKRNLSVSESSISIKTSSDNSQVPNQLNHLSKIILDEIESDEDYFEEKSNKKLKSNNNSHSSTNRSNKKNSRLSKSCDNFTVPSISPTKELSNSTSLLNIVAACDEIEEVECIDEDLEKDSHELINIKSSINLNSSFISIKTYNNSNSNESDNNKNENHKNNGYYNLSNSNNLYINNNLEGSMDSLFGLATLITDATAPDQELYSM